MVLQEQLLQVQLILVEVEEVELKEEVHNLLQVMEVQESLLLEHQEVHHSL